MADAVFRIHINADIQRVWREITKTGEAQGAVFNAWLHTTGFAPGEAMQMRTGSGRNVMVVGEIVEWNPPHCFAHTHRFTQHDDAPCQVRYELKSVGTGVEVTMKLSGLPEGTKTAKEMNSGAPSILGTLKDICETGRPRLGMRLMYTLFKYMEFVLPARCRSENWPLAKPGQAGR
jgi:uncharacterized protein YndB with AHSA1/START domain